ncbi:amidohydrolase family protein [Limosilactobacillus sp.]|uniref:metal-dependent hydrolase family protein n=1 Tax=Limosilactobacillus sp. TaxID=2773925 RepID=UPI00345E5AFC
MTKLLFDNFQLFAGTKEKIVDNAWMVVDQNSGQITAIGTGATPQADQVVDLHHQYVMPGLINAHTHMMMNALTNKLYYLSETEVTLQALANLKESLQAGITYVRDCGCAFNVDIKLMKLHHAHPFVGSRIMPSGQPMCMTGGHADFTEGEHGGAVWGRLVDSPDEMRHAVRENFKEGAQNIKVMATGGVMSATDQIDDTELSVEEMKMAVEEAHSKHMTVAAHAEGGKGIHKALLAGVDSIEHGHYLSHDDVELMKEHGTYLVPTLVSGIVIPKYGKGKLPQYMLDKEDQILDDFISNVGYAMSHGVKIAMGTDAGTPFNQFKEAPVELELMAEHGLSNFQSLQAAGIGAASLMGIDKEYGTLEKGKMADFLVLDDNPLTNIKAVQQVDKQVYLGGKKQF